MPGRKIRDEADARACLDAATRSGLPRAEWAKAHGINPRSLNAWRLNLDRGEVAPRALDFLELVPAAVVPAAAKAPRHDTGLLCVRRNDLVVEVPRDFDEDHLLRILRVVAAC